MKTLITYHSNAMPNVKVFADKQTDRRRGQKWSKNTLDIALKIMRIFLPDRKHDLVL